MYKTYLLLTHNALRTTQGNHFPFIIFVTIAYPSHIKVKATQTVGYEMNSMFSKRESATSSSSQRKESQYFVHHSATKYDIL